MRFADVTAVPTRPERPSDLPILPLGTRAEQLVEQHPDPPYNAANDPFHSDWPHW